MVDQWNRWWNSGQSDGGTVEHLMVEEWNRDGGRVEQRRWKSGTSDCGTVEHLKYLEQWNSRLCHGGTVAQK